MSLSIIYALNIFQSAGVRAAQILLILFAVELAAQPAAVGMLAAMFSLCPMALAVTAGRLADRHGPFWLMVFGSVAVVIGALMPYFFPGLPAIFFAAAMCGMQVVSYNVAMQNLVGLHSSAETRARNFSRYGLTGSMGDLAGPLIAGYTIDLVGHAHTCLYLALSWLVPLAVILIRGNTGRVRGEARRHAAGGIGTLFAEPGIVRTLAISSLVNTATNLFQMYAPVYARSVGLSASVIGILLALVSAAQFAVQIVLARLIARYKEEAILAYTLFFGAAALMIFPFFSHAVTLGAIAIAFGLATGCAGPVVNMLMFVNAPKGRSAESLGLKITTNHLTKMVSPIAFGAIGSAVGLAPMFWLDGLMLAAGGLLSKLHAGSRTR